jgi:hypothetical protein
MGRQRLEATTKLKFGSLARRQGGLFCLSRRYVFRCRIWMTRLCLILNLAESLIPGSMVFLETGSMFEEIRLQSVLSVFVFSYSPRSLFAPLA